MRPLIVVASIVWLQACWLPEGCNSAPTQRRVAYDLAGVDYAVPPPCSMCEGHCVDLHVDPHNCGACGIACPSGVCQLTDGGVPQCTCEPGDGGMPGCSSVFEPTCSSQGHCTCGGRDGQGCSPTYATECLGGGCVCGNEAECSAQLSTGCDTSSQPAACRCGKDPQCDSDKANRCDPTQTPSCRCGDNPACTTGQSCCVFDVTGANCCGGAKHYCCLDGCCDSPCLFFGFCVSP